MQYIHLPVGLRQYRTIKAAAIWPRQVKLAKSRKLQYQVEHFIC